MEVRRKERMKRDNWSEETKKAYTSPRLSVHGDAKQITQAVGAGTTDALVATGIIDGVDGGA